MEHARLGATGLKVSRLCLGTMTFGAQADEETAVRILDKAADAGVTFIDTADGYPSLRSLDDYGRSEEIIGRWLRGRRDDFVVATKCFAPRGERLFQRGTSRRAIFGAIDGSLRRLGTDYVDLYQLHHPDPDTPLEESLDALDDLVRAGKVRYVGCSNYVAYRVALALGKSDVRQVVRFVSVQSRYSLLYRALERDVLPLCVEEGLGFLPFSPLAGGMLSGKYDRSSEPPAGTRLGLPGLMGSVNRDRYWNENVFDALAAVTAIADDAGIPLPTLSIAWSLVHPGVTSSIIGATRPEQLDATLAAVDVTLTRDVLEQLDVATQGLRE